jgi:hypothetical protein
MYRGKLLDFISHAIDNQSIRLPSGYNWNQLKSALFKKQWNVYAKSVMAGPMQVIQYLGRYTHKVAIANNRIIEANPQRVYFRWRDYYDGNKMKEMSLPIDEFVGRLALHILPKGFVKIRQYGVWAYRDKSKRIGALLSAMNMPPQPPNVDIPFYLRLLEKTGIDIFLCPKCKNRTLKLVEISYRPRAPEIPCLT